MIDMARWFLGDVRRVSAHLESYVERQTPDAKPVEAANDAASLLLEFENGMHGTMQLGAIAHLGSRQMSQGFVIYGEEGTLEAHFDFAESPRVRGVRHDQEAYQELLIPDEQWRDYAPGEVFRVFGDHFATQPVGPRAFIDAILEDRPATPSFHDGLKAQEVVDAAFESHRVGRWVSLGAPPVPTD